MITIQNGVISGNFLPPLGYVKTRGGLGRFVLPVTRWLRAINTERYMGPSERHLDIGCGDGYFLKRSKCEECFGLDKILGDNIADRLEFPDAYFDYVTLLAVIEHVHDPAGMIKEIARVLKPGGRLIMTTPKRRAEWLINLYAKDIEEEHEQYFDRKTMQELAGGNFEIAGYHCFIFGLNQTFCLRKV
jgi:ubiquinone/menaquinone biosynthesis C-methylase UbiE